MVLLSRGWFSWDVVRPVLFAGLSEEVFFAGLAVLVGLRFRINLAVVIGISAILRGAMHVYQGLGPEIGAMLWGGFAVFAYYRYRSVLGLAVPHSIFNFGVAAGWMGQRWLVVTVAVVLVGFAVVYIAEIESSRDSRSDTEGGVDVGNRHCRQIL
ncbi:CPBP family intramembrane glutamic endopeptidase [Rhodococcus erythropolis]|uniref:CPBP family intramembrane glutamic endopeptidase n=1 Tax=Rhodococcus erythropolis TaxID=1833 RepID=UPI00294A230A|nr:CPBP family intramembrane glutamic endopeptidase [Rhodococcus erythropolis]MDV6277759.1 CPBP family intramembrane glutamic endopeptidase [Rhodococcus erythropolis]